MANYALNFDGIDNYINVDVPENVAGISVEIDFHSDIVSPSQQGTMYVIDMRGSGSNGYLLLSSSGSVQVGSPNSGGIRNIRVDGIPLAVNYGTYSTTFALAGSGLDALAGKTLGFDITGSDSPPVLLIGRRYTGIQYLKTSISAVRILQGGAVIRDYGMNEGAGTTLIDSVGGHNGTAYNIEPSDWILLPGGGSTTISTPVSWRILNGRSRELAWRAYNKASKATGWFIKARSAVGTAWRVYNASYRSTAWRIFNAKNAAAETAWRIYNKTFRELAWLIKARFAVDTTTSIFNAIQKNIAWRMFEKETVGSDTAWRIYRNASIESAWAVLASIKTWVQWRIFNTSSVTSKWLIKNQIRKNLAWKIFTTWTQATAWVLESEHVPKPIKVFVAKARALTFFRKDRV